MPDGRIICYKVTSRWSNALWGRKELGDTDYITAMSADGTNEVDLFKTGGGGYGEVVCSPTGEKIAVFTPNTDAVWIFDYSGNKTTILPGLGADSADWSPDGTKLAYVYNNKLYVVNADGTNNTLITSERSQSAISTQN